MKPIIYVIEVRVGPRKWEPTEHIARTIEPTTVQELNEMAEMLNVIGHRKYRVRRYVRAK